MKGFYRYEEDSFDPLEYVVFSYFHMEKCLVKGNKTNTQVSLSLKMGLFIPTTKYPTFVAIEVLIR